METNPIKRVFKKDSFKTHQGRWQIMIHNDKKKFSLSFRFSFQSLSPGQVLSFQCLRQSKRISNLCRWSHYMWCVHWFAYLCHHLWHLQLWHMNPLSCTGQSRTMKGKSVLLLINHIQDTQSHTFIIILLVEYFHFFSFSWKIIVSFFIL